MNLDLTGKRALVCGSTQGIGRAAAMELSLLGASITLLARNADALEEVVRHLPADDTESHHVIVADFTQPDRLQSELNKYLEHHTIDIVINNTGGPPAGQAIDASVEEYLSAFSQHLVCNQIICTSVVSGMKQAGWGRIINVISTSVKAPIKGLGVSNTIRGAVANWAKTLSYELGPFGITVNNVLPAAAMTGRLQAIIKNRADREEKTLEQVERDLISEIPVGRIGTVDDVASAIAFLASPAADFINGINLPVDGGKTPNL